MFVQDLRNSGKEINMHIELLFFLYLLILFSSLLSLLSSLLSLSAACIRFFWQANIKIYQRLRSWTGFKLRDAVMWRAIRRDTRSWTLRIWNGFDALALGSVAFMFNIEELYWAEVCSAIYMELIRIQKRKHRLYEYKMAFIICR